jgi:hypothetical protein
MCLRSKEEVEAPRFLTALAFNPEASPSFLLRQIAPPTDIQLAVLYAFCLRCGIDTPAPDLHLSKEDCVQVQNIFETILPILQS